MKKSLNDIFDEASDKELDRFSDKLDAPELPSKVLSSIKERVAEKSGLMQLRQKKDTPKIKWTRVSVIAACIAVTVIIGATVPLLLFKEPLDNDESGYGESDTDFFDISNSNIPFSHGQDLAQAPMYFGVNTSGSNAEAELVMIGLSVTAQYVEILPDTYTLYNDWSQTQFRLLRMKTVKLLKGQEMTEEFYYMVRENYITDFSIYDSFVIIDMQQLGYEYSVVYNKTQDRPESLNLVTFKDSPYGIGVMAENFIAYDADGNFDERLWQSTDSWLMSTDGAKPAQTLELAEQNARSDGYENKYYVHLLKDVKGDAADALAYVKNLDNGVYVQNELYSVLHFSPDVQFHVTRYVNGFATNERVDIWENKANFSKARLDNEDLANLPDLASAIATVAEVVEQGEVVPPHIKDFNAERCEYGIFGWYAKTEAGVVGIISITWDPYDNNRDDAYYIVEKNSDICKYIDRDDLVKMFGDYETTYIFMGEYDDNGRIEERIEF